MTAQAAPPKLFVSAPHPCPYLPGETATSLLLEPDFPVSAQLYGTLIKSGFRRSGSLVYRPHCATCKACVSVRIPVELFRPNRAQRRTLKRNRDLAVRLAPTRFSAEHFDLYCRYQSWRHPGDLMDHRDPDRYQEFMVESTVETLLFEYRLEGTLAALSVIDVAADGLSAVYTFFEPDLAPRSLGTHAILHQIEQARAFGLEWLYLGYWIRNCRKMHYKSSFRPLFGFVRGEWALLRPDAGQNPDHQANGGEKAEVGRVREV
ncbi:MAG: arginyltransferase [Pseudomonadota bacterium]|nr:arginyltransferase [Pseudomonadota bacterium]